MTVLFAALLMYQALCLFALAMPKYTKELGKVFKRSKKQSLVYKVTAWLLISVTLALLTHIMGFGNALVLLCGLLTILVSLIALLLPNKPFWALFAVIPNQQPLSGVFPAILMVQSLIWFVLQ